MLPALQHVVSLGLGLRWHTVQRLEACHVVQRMDITVQLAYN